MFANKLLLAAAGVSLMTLAACGEDETTTSQAQPTPPAQSEPANPDLDQTLDDAEDAAGDALSRLREAADEAATEAGRLAGEARTRAEQALEDAGPTLDRAGEVAGQIGASVGEIVERARDDIERAARELEARIDETTGGDVPEAPAGDPAALLVAEDDLNADTRAAARASMANVGPDYVGVWAENAEGCARIDQEPIELFAVVTPTTIRRYESVCNIEPGETVDGATTVSATCFAEGETEERQITLDTSEPDTLRISQAAGDEGVSLTQCSLP
ncbi:hypothetical protein [Aliihoeflea sp. 40Bstr573]|uniref:hypothetical protein n=1 Tax=Aliihoeflea sp. 40Bstr573 TaxID=2696467 RepID=UPI0020940434|nr:hypothetical protein [Aliihoeflea sp. 40Bstr573]MCO6385829.1 hypothetical protein [Aliihoeflea sp. 40Bstr573]